MKKEKVKNKNGYIETLQYSKDSILKQIGIKRFIYDLITKGNIDDIILYLGRITLIPTSKNTENNIKSIIKSVVKFYKNNIIMIRYNDIYQMRVKGQEQICISPVEYKQLLKSIGFVEVTLSPRIDGYVDGGLMIFKNETSTELINSMLNKGLFTSLIN